MTKNIFTKPLSLLFFGIALTVIIGEYFLVQSPIFAENADTLSLAITADIAILMPVLYYFLIVRKAKTPWVSALVVYLVMVGISGLILPEAHHKYVNWLEMSLIISEGILVAFILFKIRKLILQYRIEKLKNADFIINLRHTFQEVMGNAIPFVIGEIAIIRYAFFWKAPVEAFEKHQIFTIHKKSGAVAIYIALMMAVVVETVAIHLLLHTWKPTLAIVLLVLSIYSLLYMVGFAVALIKRPILLDNEKLILRVGLFWNTTFEREQIENIQLIKRIDEKDKTILNVASSMMTSPNILIEMKAPIDLEGLYGIKKSTQKIALFVDDKDDFVKSFSPIKG